MPEVSEEEKEVIGKIIDELWKLMGDFDRFDGVMHRLELLVEMMQPEYVKYIKEKYDLNELCVQLRHYSRVCGRTAKRLELILEEAVLGEHKHNFGGGFHEQ
jgi:hypothetical protein